MMLYVWMPEGAAPWRWRTNNTSSTDVWHVAQDWDELLSATAPEQPRDVTVFFPTASIQQVRVPMTRQQLRQLGDDGIRYLLEEYALGSVEQLQVRHVLAEINGSEQLTLLAMPNELIAQYSNIMALAPWRLNALLPDFLLLPLQDDQPTLLCDGLTQLLRLDATMGIPAEDLTVVLPRLPTLTQLTVLGQPSGHQLDALEQADIVLTRPELPLLPPKSPESHVFNLLPKPKNKALSPYWRSIAAVFVVALLVQVLHDTVMALRYQRVAENTKNQVEQQFRQWFPEETRIIDVRRQVSSHLRTQDSTDLTALSLLARVGPVLQQAQLVAQAVRYRDERLEIEVNAANLPALELLRTQLTQQGLNAELGAVNTVGSQVSGLIQVKL